LRIEEVVRGVINLHKDECCELDYLSNIIILINSRRIVEAWLAVNVGEKKHAHRFVVGKSKHKRNAWKIYKSVGEYCLNGS
jgi:hypothetical protein